MVSFTEIFSRIGEALDRLFQTPINQWDWVQWVLALVLVSFFISCCCGGFRRCCGGGGRKRYYQRNRDQLLDPRENRARNGIETGRYYRSTAGEAVV